MARPLKLIVGPSAPGLGRVVEDHVQDDADAGPVQGLDHVAELPEVGSAARRRCSTRVGAEEAVRAVAPVVGQAQRGGAVRDVLVVKGHDGHEFHVGDAQILEIGDLLHQPGEGARGRHPGGGVAGETAHVQLIE